MPARPSRASHCRRIAATTRPSASRARSRPRASRACCRCFRSARILPPPKRGSSPRSSSCARPRCRASPACSRGDGSRARPPRRRAIALPACASTTRPGCASRPRPRSSRARCFRPEAKLVNVSRNVSPTRRRPAMTISMYKTSVPIFVQFLTSLSAVLDKAAAFAEAKKVEPSVLLNTRLAPDMFPLVRQVRAATDDAVNAGARLAGVEPPSFSNAEATIPELKERIAKAVDFLKGLKAAQVDGSEDKEIKITFPSGAVREFTGQALLRGNSLHSFYFYCTTAYDILRHCGIELGKRDFMGTPVSM